ncbi:unnamed protein product [Amoebophrya sp. A25]|nr:unnamed protein product [Amoebophrya sp. A25]|eukprot:GSA25T00006866001.1
MMKMKKVRRRNILLIRRSKRRAEAGTHLNLNLKGYVVASQGRCNIWLQGMMRPRGPSADFHTVDCFLGPHNADSGIHLFAEILRRSLPHHGVRVTVVVSLVGLSPRSTSA